MLIEIVIIIIRSIVKRTMPAKSFNISTPERGSKNKSGPKKFLQRHLDLSSLLTEPAKISISNKNLSTNPPQQGIVPNVDISKLNTAGESADLDVSTNNSPGNPLSSQCTTGNKMIYLLKLLTQSSSTDLEKGSEYDTLSGSNRPGPGTKSKKNLKPKLIKNKPECQLNNTNQSWMSDDENKSALSKADESNIATSGSFCKVCYVECGSVELLQEHLEREESMICRVCIAEFSSHKELETHFFTHKKYNCRVCQERFSDKKALLGHRKSSERCSYEEECEICSKKFFGKKYLNKHKLIFHNDSNEHLKCVVCGNGFILIDKLNSHLQTCHNAYVKVECSTCRKWYLGPDKLKMHVKAVHLDCNKDHESACSVCGKRFSNVQNLKKHVEIHDVTDCLCEICGKSIKGKPAMKRHMQYEHSRSGTFICKSCNQQFDMEVKLMRHRKKVHSKRSIPFPVFCEICGKEYKSKAILKNHRLTHFDEKPFECEICGASFKQQSTLNTHKRVHDSEGKFRCNNCEMTFKWKHVFVRHTKKCLGDG